MTRIYVFAGVLILGALAATATENQWEYHEVSIRVSNETLVMEKWLGSCWVCKWIVRKIRHYIGTDEPSKEQMKNLLKEACNEIGFMRMVCKHLLAKCIDILVEEISTTDNEEAICATVHVC